METLKEFFRNLKKNYDDAINQGNVMLANEITANIMVGSIMVFVSLISLICLAMNEIGIFTADRVSMRFGVLLSFFIEIPAVSLNKIHHGNRPWLKTVLCLDLAVQAALLVATLGHNAALISVLPMLVSIRYCDEALTRRVSALTIFLTIVASIYCCFFGIVNLNAVKITDTVLVVTDSLRDAVVQNIDRTLYMVQMMLNDFVPRLLIMIVFAITSSKIAGYGRNIIEVQSDVSGKNARIETELTLATKIQASMLPCIFPPFKDYDKLELYALNRPAKEVGGDFYDYFRIDEDHVAFVMADVSGKGIGAALFMTITKTIIKNYLSALISPAEALTAANHEICENNEVGLFVTVWAGVYEISTERFTYTNAGHNPPILFRKGQDGEWLNKRHGFVLGGIDNTQYKETTMQLNSGDELFLYTDGVTDAVNTHQELYGEERLYHCLSRNANLNVKKQLENVLINLEHFTGGVEQFDDITMMAIRIDE